MPTAREIESALFQWAPRELAMDWDNVGLLVGDPEKEIHRILVALDITADVVEEAIVMGAELIVSHHPLMNCKWLPVQTLREDTPRAVCCAGWPGRMLPPFVCIPIWMLPREVWTTAWHRCWSWSTPGPWKTA